MIWKTILLIIILNVIFASAARTASEVSRKDRSTKEPSKRRGSTHSTVTASSVAPRSDTSSSLAPSSVSATSIQSTATDSTVKPAKRGPLSEKNLQKLQSSISSNAASTNGGAPLTPRDPNDVYPDESASNVHVNRRSDREESTAGGSKVSGKGSRTGRSKVSAKEPPGLLQKIFSKEPSGKKRRPKKPEDKDKDKKKHRRPSSKAGSSVVSGSTATTAYPASEYSAAGYAPSAAGTESTLYPRSEMTGSDVTIHATDQHYDETGYYSGSDADSTIYEEDEEEEYYEPAPQPDYYKGEDGKTYTRGGFEVAMSDVNPKLVTETDLTYGTKNVYQLPAAGAAQYLNNKWKKK